MTAIFTYSSSPALRANIVSKPQCPAIGPPRLMRVSYDFSNTSRTYRKGEESPDVPGQPEASVWTTCLVRERRCRILRLISCRKEQATVHVPCRFAKNQGALVTGSNLRASTVPYCAHIEPTSLDV